MTPSIEKSLLARGDTCVNLMLEKSIVYSFGMTSFPGRNLSDDGLGVFLV